MGIVDFAGKDHGYHKVDGKTLYEYALELEAELAAKDERIRELTKALDVFAEYIVRLHDGKKDHACIECVPDGTATIGGFRCSYHRAKTLTAGKE